MYQPSSTLANTPQTQRARLLVALAETAKVNNIDPTTLLPKNYKDPNYVVEDMGHVLFNTNLLFVTITFIVVLTRIYTRMFVAGGLGGDDYMIVGAMIVLIGSTAMNCYGVQNAGIGKHFYDQNVHEIIELLKIAYALPIIYSVGVLMVKLSILLFYRRLFGQDVLLQRVVRYFMIFQVIYTLACCLTYALLCRPFWAWWDIYNRAHSCPTFKKITVIYVSLRVITVLTDIIVLLLPSKIIWQLRIPARQRAGLACVFALGLLACIVAIARLSLLPRTLNTLDVSWSILPIALLDQAEQSLGIITASIPALTALISRLTKRRPRYLTPKKHRSGVSGGPTGGGGPPGFATGPCGPGGKGGRMRAQQFDFLAFAYDPDRAGVNSTSCYACAASDENLVPHYDGKKGGGSKKGKKEMELSDRLGNGTGMGEGVRVVKTTQVTVDYS